MVASRSIEEEIRAQKRIIGRLKREIFGVDKTHKSSYIREFQNEFSAFRAVCSIEEMMQRAAESDIVYFGDYHPLSSSQDWILRLMDEMIGRGRKVVLALEMLYVHQQESLDRWMKGRMSERRFLDAINYQWEWGFNWKSYRRLFERAKDPFIPVFGIDSEPRDHLRFIRSRDRLAAQRIRTIRGFFPGHLILVAVGESHLASSHLPAETRRYLDGRYREVVIVQNMDEIYWRLLRRGREDAEAVRVGENRYCIFSTSPILKYQAYREIIDVWTEGEETDRQTPVIHEMVENIVSFLSEGERRPTVVVKGAERVPVDALFPEVHCRKTYHAFSSFLRARRMSHRGAIATLESLRADGMSYVPALNGFLMVRFEPFQAAREAARFVLFALRDEIGRAKRRRRTPEDRLFAFLTEETLVCFGAKIVNPTKGCASDDPLPAFAGKRCGERSGPTRHSPRDAREMASLLQFILEYARHPRGRARAARRLDRLARLGITRRMAVVKAAGKLVGEAMYRAFHGGRISRAEIRSFFEQALEHPGDARAVFLEIVRSSSSYLDEPQHPHFY